MKDREHLQRYDGSFRSTSTRHSGAGDVGSDPFSPASIKRLAASSTIQLACDTLIRADAELTIRVGAARALTVLSTRPYRSRLAADLGEVIHALNAALADRHPYVRRAAKRGLKMLKGWAPTEEEIVLAILRAKREVLRDFVASSPETRQSVMIEAKQVGADPSMFFDDARLEAFREACREDMIARSRDDRDIRLMLAWIWGLSSADAAYYAGACLQPDSTGDFWWLPNFTKELEPLMS